MSKLKFGLGVTLGIVLGVEFSIRVVTHNRESFFKILQDYQRKSDA